MLERSPLACIPDVLLEQLKAGITKVRVAINTVSFFLFFMDTLPRVAVDWVSSNELVLTSRMFVLSWTRPDLFLACAETLPLRDSAGINRTSEPRQKIFYFQIHIVA